MITIWQIRFDDSTPTQWVSTEDQALSLQEKGGDKASVAPVACGLTAAGVLDMLNKLERGQYHLLEPSY